MKKLLLSVGILIAAFSAATRAESVEVNEGKKEAVINVGDELVIRLRENNTTSPKYRWGKLDFSTDIFKMEVNTFEQPNVQPGFTGAPGHHVFILRALKSGNGPVEISTSMPGQSFTARVIVKEKNENVFDPLGNEMFGFKAPEQIKLARQGELTALHLEDLGFEGYTCLNKNYPEKNSVLDTLQKDDILIIWTTGDQFSKAPSFTANSEFLEGKVERITRASANFQIYQITFNVKETVIMPALD